jgi:hypothetical protein
MEEAGTAIAAVVEHYGVGGHNMPGAIGFILFAVAAALTYEMPLLLAQLFGARAALVAWWISVSAGDLAGIIIFIAFYVVIGVALWAAPLWYVVTVLRPEGGQAMRQRTGAVLSVALLPVRPVLDRIAIRFEQLDAERRDRLALKELYRREFATHFPSFERFMAYYRHLNSEGYIDPRQPFKMSADPLKDAEAMLGLKIGYTAEDLTASYRALMRQNHPDVAAPSDLARRITEARDMIVAAKGWRR